MSARLIERKRDGDALSESEWRGIIEDFTADRMPDYQMSALLMAVRFQGLNQAELNAITDAMIASGAVLTFDNTAPVLDKHSTGGVGDKVSLVLAPLIASCGVRVPMMSGRGLGHSGGTLDKLESIPGFRTDISIRAALEQIDSIGCAMIGQTDEIAPADKRLYALRDVTATVEILPLIAASIMSKKIAEGLDGLVLDVKRGNGAFLPAVADGLALARTMVDLGEARGCRTTALVTAMDQPLGRACGNALEAEEAIMALRGEGPEDLMGVTMALGGEMLMLAGAAPTVVDARAMLDDKIRSGAAARRFGEIIEAQGGNPAIVDDPSALPQAVRREVFHAPRSGVVTGIDTRAIGWGIVEMGGGRKMVDDDIDPAVGFVCTVALGDAVEKGQPLVSVHASASGALETGVRVIAAAIRIEDIEAERAPLVSHRVTADGVQTLDG